MFKYLPRPVITLGMVAILLIAGLPSIFALGVAGGGTIELTENQKSFGNLFVRYNNVARALSGEDSLSRAPSVTNDIITLTASVSPEEQWGSNGGTARLYFNDALGVTTRGGDNKALDTAWGGKEQINITRGFLTESAGVFFYQADFYIKGSGELYIAAKRGGNVIWDTTVTSEGPVIIDPGSVFDEVELRIESGSMKISAPRGDFKVKFYTTPASYGTIETRVWNDTDGDGIQDNGENGGVAGMTVDLVNGDGETVATDVTGGNGVATFIAPPGNYRLKYSLLPDHAFTQRNKGSNEGKDSDPRPQDGLTHQFALGVNQTVNNVDAGVWVPGTVTTRVWNDTDGDGIQDNGENGGVEGVGVQVIESDGTPLVSPNGEPTSGVTDASGQLTLYAPANRAVRLQYTSFPNADYAFTQRNKGSNEGKDSDPRPQDGWTQTFQANRGSQNFTHIDAGVWAPGTVTTRVWNDTDGDGIQDNGENGGVEGIGVMVIEVDGTPLVSPNGEPTSGVTDANGQLTLYAPANRAVRLKYTLLPDHAFTQRNKGSNEGKDSDPRPQDGWTQTFQANRGSQNFTHIDGGVWVPGTVTTRVWNDTDGDGIQDNGENGGLEGIAVKVVEVDGTDLVPPNGETVAGVTGPNGQVTLYTPANRAVRLMYTLPQDYAYTQRNKGSNEGKDSDPRPQDGLTQTFQANRGSQNFTHIDAGMWVPGTAQARVWYDRDGDGIQDNGENGGIAGVTVKLIEVNGDPVSVPGGDPVEAVSGDNGIAVLPYVPANRPVRLQFEEPTNADFTQRNKGSNEGKDSDPRPQDGWTQHFQANRGSQTFTHIDAGLIYDEAYINLVTSCGFGFGPSVLNNFYNVGLGELVDCSTTDLYELDGRSYDPDKVKRLIVGQRTDGRAGHWEVNGDDVVVMPRQNSSPGNCCGGANSSQLPTQVPNAPSFPFENWDMYVTSISDDGRIMTGFAVANGTPYIQFGKEVAVPEGRTVGVYWVQGYIFSGRTGGITKPLPTGDYDTVSGGRVLVLNDGLAQALDVTVNSGKYVISGVPVAGSPATVELNNPTP